MSVVARNYGIAALVMFVLAALYGRIRNSLCLGFILAILCNTNVPSCMLAAAFLLFRFVEMLTDELKPGRRDWLIFAGNTALAAVGAALCFITVYPTFNNAAISDNSHDLSVANLFAGLLDLKKGFSHVGYGWVLLLHQLPWTDSPAGSPLRSRSAGLIGLKLFFYFV